MDSPPWAIQDLPQAIATGWQTYMQKVRIVWRRTGKEHGEDFFQVNPPEVVEKPILNKIEQFNNTPDSEWRWWQLSDEVLVEIPAPSAHYKPSTRIFYLPKRHFVAIADLQFGGPHHRRQSWEPEMYWYVHVGDIAYESRYGAWIFTDLFTDVLSSRDGLIYRVDDLNDLAEAMRIGLIDPERAAFVLERTQVLIAAMGRREFPFPELKEAMERVG